MSTTAELDESQQAAVATIQTNIGVSVMTGSPGTGKTTTIKQLLSELYLNGVEPEEIYLGCPTGKASKVLEEALQGLNLKNPPMTLHRLLGFDGRHWTYTPEHPLPAAYLVIDEASMVDSVMLARVLRSITPGCRVLLVGDKNQLPPVQAGCPFRDIVSYGDHDRVAELKYNHRQAEGSLIADACSRVVSGKEPRFGEPGEQTLGGGRDDDLFWREIDDKNEILLTIEEISRPWHNLGEDYCLLAPQRNGVIGVEEINKHLQAKLNPPAPDKRELKVSGWLTLRDGDKVLHTQNNYDLKVFNGFTGRVVGINSDPDHPGLIVDFDGRLVTYTETSHIKQLALGYCLTIHKSQGSQFRYGIIVCHSSHTYMLTRQLLYTAISRFKEGLYVVGERKAVKRAIKNNVENYRNTWLKLALGEEDGVHN